MKVILVALAFVAVASAASIEGPIVEILRSLNQQQPEGSYRFGFESSDGTKREETGEVKVVPNEKNEPQPVITVRGSYTYTDKEGVVETVNYEADENGYRAFGPSIPQPVSGSVQSQ